MALRLGLAVLASSASAATPPDWVPGYMFGIPALTDGELRLKTPTLCDRAEGGAHPGTCAAPRVIPTLGPPIEPWPPTPELRIDQFNAAVARLLPAEAHQLGVPRAQYIMVFNERGYSECSRAYRGPSRSRKRSSDPTDLNRPTVYVGVALLSGSMQELARGPVEPIAACDHLLDCRLLREPSEPHWRVGNGLGGTGALWASCLCKKRSVVNGRMQNANAVGPLFLECASTAQPEPGAGTASQPSSSPGPCGLRARLLSDSLGGYVNASMAQGKALGVSATPHERNTLPFWYGERLHILWGLRGKPRSGYVMSVVAVNASLGEATTAEGGRGFRALRSADMPPNRVLPLVRPEQLAPPTSHARAPAHDPVRAPLMSPWMDRMHLSAGPLLLPRTNELLLLAHVHNREGTSSAVTLGPAAAAEDPSALARALLANGTTRFTHHYTQMMLVLDAQPPFTLRRLGPEWCFPALSSSSAAHPDCESIQFVCGMEAVHPPVAERMRYARSAGERFDRPSLRFSYGVNDCTVGVARVALDEVVTGLRPVEAWQAALAA